MEMDSLSSGGQKSEPGLRTVRPLEALWGSAPSTLSFWCLLEFRVSPTPASVFTCLSCVCVCEKSPSASLVRHLGGHLGPTR